MHEFQLTRVDRPEVDLSDRASVEDLIGGQWEWCWASAHPYRAVATPTVGAPMPAAPRAGADFMAYLGYWCSLQGFLTHSFGWTRHDRGLRWWYDAGRPTDDPRLALLDAVWARDGNLIAYAEWFHSRLDWFHEQALTAWTSLDRSVDELTPAWERDFREARSRAQGDLALTPHGKHLEAGDHSAGPTATDYTATLVVVPNAERRAIYAAESPRGWYRGLVELGEKLPALSNASWRVEVYVRQIGFLGVFRRSRVTGLWFSGRHRFHTVGN